MVSKLIERCPSCSGELKITTLACKDCGMELRGEFTSKKNSFSELLLEDREFLATFLKCRGNMRQLQGILEISYPTAKKRLDSLLYALHLLDQEEFSKENRGIMDVNHWNVDENSTEASDIVKRKLKECGGRTIVTSYSGNEYEVWAELGGESFGCDGLHNNSYRYCIFDIVIAFLKKNGGKAKKGNGHKRLGSKECGVDTIAGIILQDYLKVPLGGSGFDPGFIILAVLEWAGLVRNKRGYVELTGVENEKEVSLSDVEKLEHEFEEELRNKMFLAKKECNYNPTRFNQMLYHYGGVETAKRLIQDSMQNNKVSDGFTRLLMEERLNLTVEDSVCKPEYTELFTADEIAWCKKRLKK